MICQICKTDTGKVIRRKTGPVHAECSRMMTKGYLYTGYHKRPKDSTGDICRGCGDVISGPHAHRKGVPYHRECLT